MLIFYVLISKRNIKKFFLNKKKKEKDNLCFFSQQSFASIALNDMLFIDIS
jgi:hypothetical protein